MNIVGVVTLYRPDATYVSNIGSYIDYLDKLYVVDNTPEDDCGYFRELQQAYPNVICLSSGKNLGISGALNCALSKAIADGHHRLLTMDQDSHFSPEQAQRYFASIERIDDGAVAVIAPHHRKIETDEEECRFVERDIVYTSGNVLNVEVASKIGMFDEHLFIDSVDHEYCLRAKMNRYRIIQATNCYLNHNVGNGKATGFFFLRKKIRSFHSPKRFYFMVRNYFYIEKLYGDYFRIFFRKLRKELRKEFISSMKYSDVRSEYIYYVIKAWRDYRKGLFGNTVGI